MKNKNMIKIFLDDSCNALTKYDNMLYDCGWFREIFIESVIDDAERVNFYIGNNYNDKLNNICTMSKVNNDIITEISELLTFTRPTQILDDVIKDLLTSGLILDEDKQII